MKPVAQRMGERPRAAKLTQFLNEMVIPADFELDDLGVVEEHLANAPDKARAFCEWFCLGDWFLGEMEQVGFDISVYLGELRRTLEVQRFDKPWEGRTEKRAP